MFSIPLAGSDGSEGPADLTVTRDRDHEFVHRPGHRDVEQPLGSGRLILLIDIVNVDPVDPAEEHPAELEALEALERRDPDLVPHPYRFVAVGLAAPAVLLLNMEVGEMAPPEREP